MTLTTGLLARAVGLPPATTPAVDVERGVRLQAPDGVELVTDLYLGRPLEPRPTVLIRSPYGRSANWGLTARFFAERGYHAVIQSCRGTFGSGGEVTFSAEAGDGRAAADWIVTQRWSNGEIGTFGPSYLSFVQWALASTRPPQLRAMAIQIMSADRSRSYYPGGAFALDNSLTWTYLMAHEEDGLGALVAQARQRRVLAPVFQQLPLRDLDVVAVGHEVPYYQDWLAHVPGDEWWDRLNFRPALAEHRVPTSFVGAWYDYYLPYMLEEHGRLAEQGVETQLVVGPWRHASPGGLVAGLREGLAWFDRHLLGRAVPAAPPVRVTVMGGGGVRSLEAWPPPATERRFHLQPAGLLGEAPPPESDPDRHRYDPADPTPAVGGTSLSSNSGPRDNRALEARPDVLTYTTPALAESLTVIGPVRAEVFIDSSTQHFDVFVRLCDVDRDGRSVNVCDGILRCVPGQAEPVVVELRPTAHRFAAGHRVRVQVSGGSHPRFARNLGSGEPVATGTTLVAANRAVHHDPARPSAIVLPSV